MTDIGPEVRTASGTVRGRRAEGLAIFRGTPFSSPTARMLLGEQEPSAEARTLADEIRRLDEIRRTR